MPTWEPAALGFSTVLSRGFVLLVPPEPVCLHCRVSRFRACIELGFEVTGPNLLPILEGHVYRGKSVFHAIEPNVVARSHRHQPYIKRPTPTGKIDDLGLSDRLWCAVRSRQLRSCLSRHLGGRAVWFYGRARLKLRPDGTTSYRMADSSSASYKPSLPHLQLILGASKPLAHP